MTDRMTPEQRHRCMSSIHSKATRPELAVHRWLWTHGYRYRLNVRSVPGSPDIVMRPYRTAIFVNGCFWHGHGVELKIKNEELKIESPVPTDYAEPIIPNSACCKIPRTNRNFWLAKIRRNQERDARNYATLQAAGWQVIVVWECQLKPVVRLEQTMRDVELLLCENLLRIHRPHTPQPDPDGGLMPPSEAKPTPLPYSADEESPMPMAAEDGATYGNDSSI